MAGVNRPHLLEPLVTRPTSIPAERGREGWPVDSHGTLLSAAEGVQRGHKEPCLRGWRQEASILAQTRVELPSSQTSWVPLKECGFVTPLSPKQLLSLGASGKLLSSKPRALMPEKRSQEEEFGGAPGHLKRKKRPSEWLTKVRARGS